MVDRSAQMYGQINTGLGLRALTSRLKAGGVRAEVRDSCHYQSGQYLRLSECDEFTLERIGAGEYLAQADADTILELVEAASRVSVALAGLGIRHRFEVYGAGSEMTEYLHYRWPLDTGHGAGREE